MIFSSAIFVFGFLPAFLGVYYAVPSHWRTGVILLGSSVFYAWWRLDYLLLVYGVSIASWLAASAAYRARDIRSRKCAVMIGVSFDLAVLGYFKYTMFFMNGFNELVQTFGGGVISVPSIILPIGISFLIFQCISYIIDVARRDAEPASNLLDFMAFSTLFPQLIAGPVLRYKDVAQQLVSRRHTTVKFSAGMARFVQGLAMKLLIADSVAPLADRIFALPDPTAAEAWLGALAYSVQLLFDFAGYSAMAIGLGLMLGFRFVENFDAPYTSRSITEFWRRWHISLSLWLRDYLYVPLGGNRKGPLRTYINLMATMVLGGLWHGANWTFLAWEAWHGAWLAAERLMGAKGGSPWPAPVAWPITMVLVIFGWVLFRAETLGQAVNMWAAMAGVHGWAITAAVNWQIQPTEVLALIVGGLLSLFAQQASKAVRDVPQSIRVSATSAAFVAACAILIEQSHSPFLYFQF